MAQYDTTATCQEDARIQEDQPNTFHPSNLLAISPLTGARYRMLFNFKAPSKPLGADSIDNVWLVLTYKQVFGTSLARWYRAYKVSQLWTEASATWNEYASGASWGVAGGDTDEEVAIRSIGATSYGASFAWDIGRLNLDWGERGSVLIRDTSENVGTNWGKQFFDTDSGTTSTVAFMPHVVMRYTDDPPPAIMDLSVSPDVSLSEASYLYRQRAVLTWTASNVSDFLQYRIRYGKNLTDDANFVAKEILNSSGSTVYLDEEVYTSGTTINYNVRAEDKKNTSADTNLGNIVGWTKPTAIIGVFSDMTPDVLQEVEINIRASNMAIAKKAKVYWGDGGHSFSQSLTTAGGYFYAKHRYTKATTVTARAQIEDIYGFRSGPTTFSTSIVVANLGPVAKIVASPSRQRTASTFNAGFLASAGVQNVAGLYINLDSRYVSRLDGVARRFHTRASSTAGTFYAQLWRDEGDRYRCIQSVFFTTTTFGANIGRDVNWRVSKGDYIGIQTFGFKPVISFTSGTGIGMTTATARTPGEIVGRFRFQSNVTNTFMRATVYTNPVHFSAKDSFARASNRVINRFRWDTDYNGTFGSDFDTGATSSFYYAWTSATTQFVAVRAVDDSHASSVDIAGVVIETESTFRFPDDLRDAMEYRSSPRSRAYTQMAVVGRDYGVFDFGSIEPRTVMLRGLARSLATGSNNPIDIDRISAAFQQRKRIYVLPGESAATAVRGYIVEEPIVEDANDPVAKQWSLTVAVAQ